MISQLCNDIYAAFIKDKRSKLFEKVAEFSHHFYYHHATLDDLETIFSLERKVMKVIGKNKQRIEDAMFDVLLEHSIGLAPSCSYDEALCLNKDLIESAPNQKEQEKYITTLQLASFAIETFRFSMPKDNFRTRRKTACLDILSNITHYYEIPDVFDLSLLSLKSRRPDLIIAAIGFQESYTENRRVVLTDEVLALLNKIALKTKDHSIVSCALDLQVTEGHMSQFEALRKMGLWKARNEDWNYSESGKWSHK